jgi:large subunit ribosomal protein L22
MATVSAKTKYVRISPQKTREVLYLVEGKSPLEAIGILKNLPQRPAAYIAKTIVSALANVRSRKFSEENFRLKSLVVEQGPRLKRCRPASMGKAVSVVHRTSHLKVVLSDEWDKK